jgi:hypothetical protein
MKLRGVAFSDTTEVLRDGGVTEEMMMVESKVVKDRGGGAKALCAHCLTSLGGLWWAANAR